MGERIKRLINYYIRIYGTNDPFIIAKGLNIKIFFEPLGFIAGYYIYMERHRCIYINSDIDDEQLIRIIMAHELGHAIMHWKENCYFLQNRTLLSTSKIEIEANKFAAELLITDELLQEFEGYTIDQFSACTGISKELIHLKLK